MEISSNISKNSNVSNLIASSISKLNLNSVKKPDLKLNKQIEEKNIPSEEIIQEENVIPTDEKPKTRVDVDDIQKYAQMVGEKVSVDDINYGIMYGRSVIADYIA